MSTPDWLAQPQQTSSLPTWLSVHPAREPDSPLTPRAASPEGKALLFKQYEMVFPRVLEMVCAGYTVSQALKEMPIDVDSGAFLRWIKKNSKYNELYKEAKEVRTETWAGEMIKHALGEETEAELDRSKFIVDTYKWLMSRENRREYGESKTIEMNTSISITAALEQAQTRVIDAQLIDDDDDVETLPASQYKQLTAAVEDDDE